MCEIVRSFWLREASLLGAPTQSLRLEELKLKTENLFFFFCLFNPGFVKRIHTHQCGINRQFLVGIHQQKNMANVSLKGEGNVTLYYGILQILNRQRERRTENNDTKRERETWKLERERESSQE